MAISLNSIDSLGLAARGFARLRAEKVAKEKVVVGAVTSKDAVTMTASGIAVPKDAPGTTAYTGHTVANPFYDAFAESVRTGTTFVDPGGSVTTETLKDMAEMLAKYRVDSSKLTGPDRGEWLSEENAKIKNARMWDFLPEKRSASSLLQERQLKTLRAIAQHAPEFFDTAGKSRIADYATLATKPRTAYLSEDLIGVCHLVGMCADSQWHRDKVDRIERKVWSWSDSDHEEVTRLAKIDDTLLASRIQVEEAEKALLDEKKKRKAEQERLQRVAAAEARQVDLDAIVAGVLEAEQGGDW